jgi:hypothetical protein
MQDALRGWRVARAAAIAGLLCGPVRLTAQGQSPLVPTLDSIGPGCCTIRIRHNGVVAEGKFRGRTDGNSILLAPCHGPLCPASDSARALVIPTEAQLEMRSGNHGALGAVIGAVTGAALVAGMFLASSDVEPSFGEAALGVGVGALGGTLVGFVVGTAFPRWVPLRH